MTDVRTPSNAQVIRKAVDAATTALRVAMPGKILNFDAATQTATVQPCLYESHLDETDTEVVDQLQPISNVPVQFPGAGGFSITFPVSAGDPCLLIFADRSIDRWWMNGDAADPIDLRRHSLNDAIAILGVRPKPSALPSFDGANVTLGKDGQPADFVALAAKVNTQLTNLKTAINGWTPVPNDGGAALKAALTALFTTWPGSVASATVKVKG